ncbi:MAG: hypothetical protein B7Y40_00015 [Gammaproteobacteria bacterium 28-57-27]|nr:MAG: hypothetical protein B7Y40_00015 [Gammaproteobacteria bacterium 28-57-27]
MNRVLLQEGRYALERLCRETPVSDQHALLLQALAELWPRWNFRHALTRGGWHRPGRVYDAQGDLLAEDAEAWIEQAWLDCGEESAAFCECYLERGLQLSRFEGRTHFFVAAYGKKAEQFIQLEIEELCELIDRPLLDPAHLPNELDELLEPPHHTQHTPRCVLGETRYRFRRVTDMAEFLARLRGQRPDAPPACRFVEEWNQSSSAAKALCAHWVFALAEHLDRFKQPVLNARPLSLDAGEPMDGVFATPSTKPSGIVDEDEDEGLQRAEAIRTFDRQRGYSAAWYFHMLAGAGVPTALAARVGEDMARGLSYLPERDASLLAQWLDRPYTL